MDKDFKITKVRQDYFHEMKNEHFHEAYEVYYLISGQKKFFLNNKIYRVNEGDVMIIPKGEIHRTTYFLDEHKDTVIERVALTFSDKFIENIKNELGENKFQGLFANRHLVIPPNRRAYLADLFEKLLLEYKEIDEYSQLICKRYVEEVVLFLIRCQQYVKEPIQTSVLMEDKVIENAAHFMSIHFAENITLHSIADRFCMSDAYFSKKFKKVTGFGFKEYLNTIRIRHASDLLLNTKLTITEISDRCGFTDSNYFGDAFKKVKNLSPRDYRKANLL